MRLVKFIPENTKFDFVRHRFIAFAVSGALLLVSLAATAVVGLNLGIDFRGGILMEVRAPQPVDLGPIRAKMEGLNLGEVELQHFGDDRNILIRVQRQEGGEAAQNKAVQVVRNVLGEKFEYRRVELVGPKVGGELMRDGVIATALAVLGIAIYVAFRFEWQFAVAALIATGHDVLTTVGLYSVLQLEFNLTSVAAVLTLAGYSVNDTVVVFDRIREVLRKRKTATLADIINESVNATLSRTLLTGSTTLLAILPLLAYGGSTLFNFSVAMLWGILVGTYSSIFVAACLLLYMPPVRRMAAAKTEEPASGSTAAKTK